MISGGRKTAYYIGTALMVLGGLSFASVFVTAIIGMGNPFGGIGPFGGVGSIMSSMASMAARAFGGIVLIGIGAFVQNIGRQGLAGSGVVLDPEKARDDMKPWSKMAGGMINDTLTEVEAVDKIADGLSGRSPETAPKIMVRCPHCKALNDEGAKFCDQCGAGL
jgi:hypothetical protein